MFALTSLIVFVVIGAFITTFRARDVRAREERAAASRAELVANEAIGPELTASDLSGPVTGARYDEIESAVRTTLLADPGILRVKLWSPTGMVTFSNDQQEVGLQPTFEDDLKEALGGELQSDVSDLTADENVGERQLGSRLFETYVPFRVGMSGPVVGVIEVYQDYSVIQAEIDRLTRTLSISLAVGLLALYGVMLPLMIGVTRTLRRQNNQLQEQADQLSDLLEREQDTVAELRELDRMKSDFVAATSHELRTPLTSIKGYVHILRGSSLADDPVAVEALAAIERQSSRLFRLIANVLRESNLEHDDAQNAVFMFPFQDVVDEVVADFHDAGTADRQRGPRRSGAGHRRQTPDPGRAREPRRQRAEVLVCAGPRHGRGSERRFDVHVLGERRGDRHRTGRSPSDLRALLPGGSVGDAVARRRGTGPAHRLGPARDDRRERRGTEHAGGRQHVHGDGFRSRARRTSRQPVIRRTSRTLSARRATARIRIPCFGRSVTTGCSAISCAASSSNRHRRAIVAISSSPSICANPSPMHIRGPPPNGRNACRGRAEVASSVQRSSRNAFRVGPPALVAVQQPR